MEVLYMTEHQLSKTDLWTKRIQDFHSSGLSRKEWCREHQISLSTLGYWLRKQETPAEIESEPVFAKLPSEQELSLDLSTGHVPMVIHLPAGVRIEVGSGCPAELLSSLLHVLKAHA